jgi:hypothetical protein
VGVAVEQGIIARLAVPEPRVDPSFVALELHIGSFRGLLLFSSRAPCPSCFFQWYPVISSIFVTVHGLEGQDIAFWRVSPPPTPPHNVADLSESVMAGSFAATLRGGGHAPPRERLPSIEPSDFSGLTNLTSLNFGGNPLTSIEPGDFGELTNLIRLLLWDNQLTHIEPGAFSELASLKLLYLSHNELASIESGAFTGLANLRALWFEHNVDLEALNFADAHFLGLTDFDLEGNVQITEVSLRNAVISQMSLATLLDGGRHHWQTGIGDLPGITEMDLSGIDFGDITDLEPLYVMDDLTDLWLVDTENVDASELDLLLDNLGTIEGTDTEGILYMTEANFDAFNTTGGGLLAIWNAEQGHHVEYLLLGDVNNDTEVNGLDVDPFVDVLLASRFDVAADMNLGGVVNGLDVDPFVAAVVGGTQPVPEPSILLLALLALGVVGGWGILNGR